MMFCVAVIEDDKSDREILAKHLARFAEEEGLQLKVNYFTNGLDFLETYNVEYDVVLMDIDMPYFNGMDISKQLRTIDYSVPLIFTTNMAQFAIKGYEVDAIGFVLKPINYELLAVRLKKAVQMAKERGCFIWIKTDGANKLIYQSDIYYLEVNNVYVYYHTVSGVYRERTTLLNAEKPLIETGNFVRCNNCYLVNLKYVTLLNGNTVIVGGDELIISRHRKKDFINALTVYQGKKR